jgi:UDPglucose 6-dehydrogenase
MIPYLVKKGAMVNYYDPTGEKNEFKKIKNVKFSKNIKSAIKESDLIIVNTEWNDFKSINFSKDVSNKKFVLYDMRNIYSLNKMKEQKINYFGVGR